jgi:hypothetical protein
LGGWGCGGEQGGEMTQTLYAHMNKIKIKKKPILKKKDGIKKNWVLTLRIPGPGTGLSTNIFF